MKLNYLKIGCLLLIGLFTSKIGFSSNFSVEITYLADTIPPPPIPPPPPPPAIIECGFSVIEELPRFPGCENKRNKSERIGCSQKKMLEYIYKELRYPPQAILNKTEGVAVIRFLVSKQGKIKNPVIIRNVEDGCGEEALRVVQNMNTNNIIWTPGKQRGRTVQVYFNLPIKFSLDNF